MDREDRHLSSVDPALFAVDESDVLYQTGRDGHVVWIGDSVESVLGWQPSELVGREMSALVHPDDLDSAMEAHAQMYRYGHPTTGLAVRLRTADGSYREMSLRARPFLDDAGTILGVYSVLRDEHEASAALRALTTLSRGNAVLVRAADEDELLREMCRTVVEAGGYALAWYGRAVHDDRRTVQSVASAGPLVDYVEQIEVTWDDSETGRGPSGTAIRTGTTQVKQSFDDKDFAPWQQIAESHGFRCSVSLPVFVSGVVDGALMVYAFEYGAFDETARSLLEDLAADIGYGIARLRDAQKLTEALSSSVFLLAAAVESRDPYTAGHQSHVGVLAEQIGRELGLDDDRVEGLVLGAAIHDVGKISISHATLARTGELTEAEWAELRAHPGTGYQIAGRFPWPWPIADMIHQHHERMDGSGYPLGLRGEEILLESRIIAVADTFEAMANDRPYRTAPGSARARVVLEQGRGTLFDADVVDALQRVLERGFEFPS